MQSHQEIGSPAFAGDDVIEKSASETEHQINTGLGFPIANGRLGFPIANGRLGFRIANGRLGFPIASGPTGPV
jgi:hypothetical protein